MRKTTCPKIEQKADNTFLPLREMFFIEKTKMANLIIFVYKMSILIDNLYKYATFVTIFVLNTF